jgi:RNA polymerase sigma-70 factor (ECF subfamily)
MNDAETLARICRRDPRAVADLVHEHHLPLRGYVAALCADVYAIDDLAQEVFVRALQKLDNVADLRDFGRFLRGVARNVVREHVRSTARYKERYIAFVEELHQSSETQAEASWAAEPEVLSGLDRCVKKLPVRSQEFIRLRYAEEKQADEIGRAFGLSGGAVRIALLRIREAILHCLRATVKGLPEVQA